LCQYLTWDSDFFSCRIGRILPSRLTATTAESALRWCEEEHIDCLYFLADSDDMQTTLTAERVGFALVDIRLTLEHPLTQLPDSEHSSIRPHRAEDIPYLKAIARASHTDTRFFFDTHFNPEDSARLYEIWIEKSCNGDAQQVLVWEHEGRAAAYITCHLDAKQEGKIGLVGVDEAVQGRGVGGALIQSALAWFRAQDTQRLTVVTQGRNIRAQRLYMRQSFITHSLQLWYHLWNKPNSPQFR
jgi:ribosomal protein S18 acetylase RimI-like enzyme